MCPEAGCCLPTCEGKVCGFDGCQGSCGSYQDGYGCESGVCEANCELLCIDKECGAAGLDDECDCGGCDDGNPCTDDDCAPGQLCSNVPNAKDCNDENVCTVADSCEGGLCQGLFMDMEDLVKFGLLEKCTCAVDEDCVELDDGNSCNGTLTCQEHPENPALVVCLPDPESIVICDDEVDCTKDLCDPETGSCSFDAVNAMCGDSNACNGIEVCDLEDGCISGEEPDCDDGNPCTTDWCKTNVGCMNEPNSETCDDGNKCTIADACSGGECLSGGNLDCDDDNLCTNDSCSPDSGCVHSNNQVPCSDGDVCTSSDKCAGGECAGGPQKVCDDENPCTNNFCDSFTGCEHTPNAAACSDGNECSTGDHCSKMKCATTGTLDCADENPCTNDSCDPVEGCVYSNNAAPCDDNRQVRRGGLHRCRCPQL